MSNALKFYIDGAWVDPAVLKTLPVINPATEQPFAEIAMGTAGGCWRSGSTTLTSLSPASSSTAPTV